LVPDPAADVALGPHEVACGAGGQATGHGMIVRGAGGGGGPVSRHVPAAAALPGLAARRFPAVAVRRFPAALAPPAPPSDASGPPRRPGPAFSRRVLRCGHAAAPCS